MENKKVDNDIKDIVSAFINRKGKIKLVKSDITDIPDNNIKSDIVDISDNEITINWYEALEDIKNALIYTMGLKKECDRIQWFKEFTGYEGKLKNAPTELFERVYHYLSDKITATKVYLLTKPLIEARKITLDKKIKSDINDMSDNKDSERIISSLAIAFNWTKDKLIKGLKTQTRRPYQPYYAKKFIELYQNNPHTLIRAEFKKELLGYIRLTAKPYREKLGDISREDIDKEGYPELSKEEFLTKFFSGKDINSEVWVISFEFTPKSKEVKSDINNQNISDTNDNEGFKLTSGEDKSDPQSNDIDGSYRYIENDEDLKASIATLKDERVLGIDTETTGLNPHCDKLRLIQIASENNPTLVIDAFKCNVKLLQPLLINEAVKVFHNAKFDIQFLMSEGLEVSQTIFDTQLASQLLTAGKSNVRHSLKAIASEYLGIELDKGEQLSDFKSDTLSDSQLRYGAIDAKILLRLREILREKIISASLTRVAKIEFDCVVAVAMMEYNGMLLDVAKWQEILKEAVKRKEELSRLIQELLPSENTLFKIDINLDSPQQLKEALNRYGLKVNDTNSNTLKKLLPQYPEIIKPLLEYKKCSKLISSFGDSLLKKINPITGRLHGSYWQLGSSAGRFTSSDPNLQQIPRNKEHRSCFIASPNHKLVIADYSQIELRIASEVASDKTMIEAYNRGEDLHKLTASIVLNKPLSEVTKEDRQIAKSANFGLIYGASVNGFRGYAESNYGISLSESEAKTIMDNFFKSYSGLAQWHKKTKSRIYNQGVNETRTLSNRIRYFDNASPQQILNTPIQGTGADMLKLALGRLVSALKPYGNKAKILATVHDEIILEAHESVAEDVAKTLSEVMVNSGKEFLKKVPIEADSSIGVSWADK
ncbi:bifunctional 3'-5' exonuclease/DNA polymerase [Cyanobacterium aponinum FACHB-4101]|uniref:bifunctional 3'-5' exonuclease/DNA polymerase n=1 Tax=Cyanobacterium aponinum TaxID=379064 RepID=UPI00168039C8|nr:bifunctional 3'-5' exonuclease/DNA polymerase [Cyanobacterium aponinum]MBD2395967.1 bifunctional 3'-5' exonuclease/DNA polymerase [Cyanobacterium aponinum FACHB-4101]